MVSMALKEEYLVPIWVGWNTSLSVPSNNAKQKVWYFPQKICSPTSNAVVIETMKISQNIAEESKGKSIAATYDLAIAKLVSWIQSMERSIYDYIFVPLGSFHFALAFFAALGKLIENSGGPSILQETDVLAKGSLRSFYKGLHKIISLVMKMLHFTSVFRIL